MHNYQTSWTIPATETPVFVQQKTICASITAEGVGLHSGRAISITLHPADVDTGIVLKRSDVQNGGAYIPVTWRNVVDSRLATTVGNDHGVTVSTVEHMMAALAGCEIDNVLVEVDGPEMPIMDGSAEPFVRLIRRAGIVEQAKPRRAIRISKPIRVTDGEKSMDLLPANEFGIDFQIDFASEAIAHQDLSVDLVNGTFLSEIADARTFGFEHEVSALRAAGLAQGGSLENAIVISGGKILNEEGLRYTDEFVRHKILDCVGDLYMAGAPLIGRVQAQCSGHALNHQLLCTLFGLEDAWEYEDIRVAEELAPEPVFEEPKRAIA